MKRVLLAALVAGTFVVAPWRSADAQGVRFRHLVSVYVDDKGGGLHLPEGVACGDEGRFVVGDTGNNRLLLFTFKAKAVSGGTEIKVPELAAPTKVQLNSKGEIYALDGSKRRIVRLTAEGTFREFLSFDGAPPPTAIVPRSFTIDSADNVYVLDVLSARVLVLNAEGRFQKALALPDGTGFVTDLDVDILGNVFVVDPVKRRLFSAGRDANAFSPLGGDLTGSLVTLPTSLTASRGTIFVVESGGSIASIGQDGSFMTRQLTTGWQEGSLNHPAQVCITEKDEVFVADRDNSRVQVFALSR